MRDGGGYGGFSSVMLANTRASVLVNRRDADHFDNPSGCAASA